MNKKILLVSILLSSVSCFSAYAKDEILNKASVNHGETKGTIHFTGYIYSATCTIDVSGTGGTTGKEDPVIDMGRYSTSEFGKKDSEVGGKGDRGKVKVTLTNCPDEGTMTMKLNGTPDTVTGDDHILQLSGSGNAESGSAGGVGIVLYHKGEEAVSQRIKVNGEKEFTTLFGGENTETGELIVNFVAKYTKTAEDKEAVTAGSANADLPYVITYN